MSDTTTEYGDFTPINVASSTKLMVELSELELTMKHARDTILALATERDTLTARVKELEAKLDLSEGALDVASKSWGECQRILEQTEAKLAKAVNHIEWFISEDETNRGDEPTSHGGRTWDEINEYFITHLDSAVAFVAELKGETDE
jgi:uncharacterized coiled-coil protein SlyX